MPSANTIELLTADAADLVLGSLIAPRWGIYLNGQPVIQPATQAGQLVSNLLSPIEQIASCSRRPVPAR